ncbi:hypothetical protein, partial [Streptomyces sp. NPDC097981]|uniref:hypothetical protein n=1 Tax=Streptomyces sp. NPDC097981 TaxID=3155428 RepID=UPI00332451C4
MDGAVSSDFPRIILPADSNLPSLSPEDGSSSSSHSILADGLAGIRAALNRHIPDPVRLREEVSRLRIAGADSDGASSNGNYDERLRHAHQILLEHPDEVVADGVEKFVVYDEYFGVSRSSHFDYANLGRQLSSTINRVL